MSLFNSIGKVIGSSKPYITNQRLRENKTEFNNPKDVFASMSETTENTTYSFNPEYKKEGAVNIPESKSKVVKKQVVLKSGTTITDNLNHEVTITKADGSFKKYPGKLFLNYYPGHSERFHDANLSILNDSFTESLSICKNEIRGELYLHNSLKCKQWLYKPNGGYKEFTSLNLSKPTFERDDGTLLLDMKGFYGWGGNMLIYKPTISGKDLIPKPTENLNSQPAEPDQPSQVVDKPESDFAIAPGSHKVSNSDASFYEQMYGIKSSTSPGNSASVNPDHVLLTDKFSNSNSKLSPATKDKNRFLPL